MLSNDQKFIEKLRSKPTHVRHMITFGVSTALVAIIAVAWAVSLPSRFASGRIDESSRAETLSPFEVFSDSLRETFPSEDGSGNAEPGFPSGFEEMQASSSASY